MIIMRSCQIMKDKLFKRRPQVDWYSLRLEIADPDVFWYYDVMMQYPRWRKLSQNRRSYLALLHKYGKNKLDQYRYSGIWSY